MQIHLDRSHFGVSMAESGQRVMLAAASSQARSFKAMMRYQIETLEFLKNRIKQDVRLADDLIAGFEFNDAFDVFSVFVQNATSDYTSEAAKVVALTSTLAPETAKCARRKPKP
ncbi:phasin family protein [Mesorhizobium sp. M0491]|uniref:phasin family protein n=1 Tax=Mesorhizobium sp. M0491 TaxID=2956950 RepID=UPI00333B10AF